LALIYWTIGFSDWSTLLLPALSTLLSAWLVYKYLQKKLPMVAFGGFLLVATDFYSLFFSNKLYPDVLLTPVALGMAVLLVSRRNNWVQGLGFALLACWAFLIKEMVVYFLPACLYLLLRDLRDKQQLVFWRSAVLVLAMGLGTYGWVYWTATGNAFYRFQLIENGHYTSALSYYDKPLEVVLARLSYLPLLMLVSSNGIIPMTGALLGFFRKETWKKTDGYEWHLLALGGLLMFYFFSTSFTRYEPVGLFGRFVLFLMPVFAIASAFTWHSLGSQVYLRSLSWLTLLTALACLLWVDKKMSLVYWLLGGTYGICWQMEKNKQDRRLIWGVWGLALAFHPIYTLCQPSQTGYRAEKQLIRRHLNRQNLRASVYTDDRLAASFGFYYRFSPPPGLQMLPLDSLRHSPANHSRRYVLYNPHFIRLDSLPGSWRLLERIDQVSLFEIK
jgi:hypothetical protein